MEAAGQPDVGQIQAGFFEVEPDQERLRDAASERRGQVNLVAPSCATRVLDSKSPRHYAAGSDDAKALVNPSGCHRDRRGDGAYLCGAIPRSRGHRHCAL
jgi:hypothetical protein